RPRRGDHVDEGRGCPPLGEGGLVAARASLGRRAARPGAGRAARSRPRRRRRLMAERPRRERAAEKDMSALLTPASPTLLSDTVADRLRDTIFKGHFAPGERLREESLAEALDVSRGPIRDALLQLEREGLV